MFHSCRFDTMEPFQHGRPLPERIHSDVATGGLSIPAFCANVYNSVGGPGMYNLYDIFKRRSCTFYTGDSTATANEIFVETMSLNVPFSCAMQTSGPSCQKQFKWNSSEVVFTVGPESASIAISIGVTSAAPSSNPNGYTVPGGMLFETVDSSGNVDSRFSCTDQKSGCFSVDPTLGDVLQLAGTNLDIMGNPTQAQHQLIQDKLGVAYRVMGLNIIARYEVYNIGQPSAPYHGSLAGSESDDMWDFGTQHNQAIKKHWKAKISYRMVPNQFAMRLGQTVWDSRTQGYQKIVSGVSITAQVDGTLFDFSAAVLLTTIVNFLVLLKVS